MQPSSGAISPLRPSDGHVRRYPNPGYLGQSSHRTIFGQLASSPQHDGGDELVTSPAQRFTGLGESDLLRGQAVLDSIIRDVPVNLCVGLVDSWLLNGSNLALASPLVRLSADTATSMFSRAANVDTLTLSSQLFQLSSCPLVFEPNSSFDAFVEQFTFSSARWETSGLFFTAVSMATIDTVRFPDLYSTQAQRQALRKLALHLSDNCLAISLGLDCLNDLQLIFQYENFINHSYTHGDQSFDSWKRLGDIISSIYALGYHERNRDSDGCSAFLRHIREAVFAFTYSADKNISVFLGRPPRMHAIYCDCTSFHIPGTQQDPVLIHPEEVLGCRVDGPFSYMIEAWWSLICALQKEEILGISREKDPSERKQKSNHLRSKIESAWQALPGRFKAEGKLMSYHGPAIDRDFTASARLNHLHVKFLLHLIESSQSHPSTELLATSAEILGLVTEENLINEHLVSSGTGLVWRTAYYGLPAAGILCLALLSDGITLNHNDLSTTTVYENIYTLLAQMTAGAYVDVDEPYYALLCEATTAIRSVLGKSLQNRSTSVAIGSAPTRQKNATSQVPDIPMLWPPLESWDFEIPFWTSLAEQTGFATATDEWN